MPRSAGAFPAGRLTAYERLQRRVSISLLPPLAHTLDVSAEDLIGVQATRSTGTLTRKERDKNLSAKQGTTR